MDNQVYNQIVNFIWGIADDRDYVDDDENLAIGIEKALEQVGYELPNPNNKASRYNNRMITFTAECREMWQDIVKSYGYEIETEPKLTKRKAKDKETFIAEKRAEKEIAKAIEMQEKAKIQQLQNEEIAKQHEIDRQNLIVQQAELDEHFAKIKMLKNELQEGIILNAQLAEKIKDEQKRESLLTKNKRNSRRFNNPELDRYVSELEQKPQNYDKLL